MKKILFAVLLFVQPAVAQLNIAVVGQGYKPNEQALFLSDLQNVKSELFIRLWQRQSQFNFIPLSWNNQFQCKESGFWDGGTCNDTKVVAAVNASGVSWNNILVLAKTLKGGGGGAICMAGMYYHDALRSGNTAVHELGHSLFGLQHNSIFMNSGCNQGACAQLATFNSSEFDLINQRMGGSMQSGTITIVSPWNNFTTVTGGALRFEGAMTGGVESVEIIYDGISKGVFMCWARGYECKPNQIIFWIDTLSAGQHIMTMIATDVNNNQSSHSITINVN